MFCTSLNSSCTALLCWLALSPLCSVAADRLAIQHTAIIDVTGGPLQTDSTVFIEGDRIAAIGPSRRVAIPQGTPVFEGRGKYLIPGLWDMHVHLRGGKDLIAANESWLSLFVAHGITGIREMGNDIPEVVFRWRDEVNKGQRLGPRILSPGPKIDVPGSGGWPGSIRVTDEASARAAVQQVKSLGADFVKIYANAYPPGVLQALADESRRQRLPVGGHLPLASSTVREAIDSGLNFIEHLDLSLPAGCSREEHRLQQQSLPNPGSRVLSYAETFDATLARDLAMRLAQKSVAVTPTLAVLRNLVATGSKDYESEPFKKYIFPEMWQSWGKTANGRPRGRLPENTLRGFEKTFLLEGQLVPLLQTSGVTLLAGSDSAAANVFTFPALTLHRELALLVAAGLTPLQALQTATRNPAQFLGELDRGGTVETGKVANLVLLSANPLADIQNTEKIDAVILRGRLLSRPSLDKLFAEVADQVAKAPGLTGQSK